MIRIKRKNDAERFLAEQEKKAKEESSDPRYQSFSIPTSDGCIEIFVGGEYRTFWRGRNGWHSVSSTPREKREILRIIWENRKHINHRFVEFVEA